jgi:hypothetical protein
VARLGGNKKLEKILELLHVEEPSSSSSSKAEDWTTVGFYGPGYVSASLEDGVYLYLGHIVILGRLV